MTTPEAARQALTSAFISAWAAAHPTYSYFISGISEPDMNTQTTPFALFNVMLPRMAQSGLAGANPPKRYFGYVIVSLFVPQGSGTKPFFSMQSTIENTLTVRVINGIRLYGMDTPIERTPAVGWQGRLLSIPYQFDSV